MISYKENAKGISVYLDGKKAGVIKKVGNLYQYWANGKFSSELVASLSKIKKSLEKE